MISDVLNQPDAALEVTLRPSVFEDFTGQAKVKERLGITVEAAKQRGEAIDHTLLSGPPGLGKTTIAHIIANPDKPLCERVGLSEAEAIGIMTITPGESAIIAGDLALKAADVEIGFLDRFSGTLVLNGRLSSVQSALEAANRGMADILGFHPAPITRT